MRNDKLIHSMCLLNNIFIMHLSSRKKGFTMLEVLIVIMIVGILFVAFRSSFQIKNKDVLYGQACIETLYGQINNFVYAGLSSKVIFSGNVKHFPDQYIATFNPNIQNISLNYQENTTTSIYSSIDISGWSNINYCRTSTYFMRMNGDNYTLTINKWLAENQNLQSFFITGTSSQSTGGNTFWECNLVGTWCKEMARFETDIRTISIKKYMCLSFSETWDCLEWDN